MKHNVNWTEKDLDRALGRISKDQDFHARQREHIEKARLRREKKAQGAKGKGKRAKPPKGPRKPDAIQLAVKHYTGYECAAEEKFHPTRGWKIDYALPELKIGIEQDGGIWSKGESGHSSGTGIKRDMTKANYAQVCGWVYLRFTPQEMGSDEFWRLLDLAIELQNSRKSNIL